jgi:hypothetical protein
MKLLDTNGGNTKIAKTNKEVSIRYAGLSLMPNLKLCNGAKAAGCLDACLKSAGRGAFNNVASARQAKTDWFESDPVAFKEQLNKELTNFTKLCAKQSVKPVVRLNTISDVDWSDIMQAHPGITFVDYTKIAKRLETKLPNQRLIFSYSGRSQYAGNVAKALETAAPIAVVFKNGMPKTFLGRKVIDGDVSDWDNANAGPVIIGLKAKGKAIKDNSGFVVDAAGLIAAC